MQEMYFPQFFILDFWSLDETIERLCLLSLISCNNIHQTVKSLVDNNMLIDPQAELLSKTLKLIPKK
jgi:hypothetical protein